MKTKTTYTDDRELGLLCLKHRRDLQSALLALQGAHNEAIRASAQFAETADECARRLCPPPKPPCDEVPVSEPAPEARDQIAEVERQRDRAEAALKRIEHELRRA